MGANKVDYQDIGRRLKHYRKLKGLTQEKLAEAADISVQHMSAIENAATKVGLPTLFSLSEALAVNISQLVVGSSEMGKAVLSDEFSQLLSDCTTDDIELILNLAKVVKASSQHKNSKI